MVTKKVMKWNLHVTKPNLTGKAAIEVQQIVEVMTSSLSLLSNKYFFIK